MSFAGGLALMAAADARYRDAIGVVLSIGGHDDLGRVARFFAEDEASEPDGGTFRLRAHPYGALVLAYADADGFFPPEDVEPGRKVLADALAEKPDDAHRDEAALSAAARPLVAQLVEGKIHEAPAAFLAGLARLSPRTAAVSPHEHLAGMKARAFILHGTADPVIPASEARWLVHDLPAATEPVLLITPAIGHVELAGAPTVAEQLAVVAFMAKVMKAVR
jgi:pimeloyl-ACP methyl ester carboxylesterase